MRRNLEVRILALILAIGLAANSLFTAVVPVRAEGQSGGTAGVAAISAEASVSEEDTDNSASEEKADIEEPEETEAPETEAPETEAPETEAETEAPETEAPETEAPETEAETEAPETEAPETEAPETEAPSENTAPAETSAAETAAENTEEETEADPADETAEEETEEAETEEVIEDPLTGEITLTKTIEASDGMTYTISVTCPAEAGIPEDAGLKVKEIKGKNSEAYLEKTAEALAWADDDVVFYSVFFDISITEGKYEIQPAAPVQVSIKMLDLAENASAAKKTANALQVVHFDESGREMQAEELNNKVSMDKTDAELTFETNGFSVFGIGGVASKVLGWITDKVSATVLGIAGWFKPKYTASTISDIEEGLEVLEAYNVSGIKPLWINIVRNTVADLGKLESISIYGTKDGKLAEELKANVGFGDDVTVSLDSIDGYALVKDTGLRHRALTLNAGNNTSVALDGMMPKGSSAIVEDVTGEEEYADALAAVDITINNNNEEFQPEAGSPISVSIYNSAIKEAIAAGTGIEVWHVKDDGTEEKVENVSLTEDGVGFAAEGFSKYIVREVVLDGTITAGDGKTYKVTVTYDPECGIPADAKLKVSEVTDGTVEYLEETAKALHLSVEDLGFSRLFDISIVGKDGTEYQPNEAVTVKVELLDAAEEDTEDLHVVHFGENEDAKELAAQADGSVVTFETDGFSVFSFAGISLLERVFEAVLGKSSNTIFENDDIVLTGKMPALGLVEANPVNVQVNGQDALVAYDIKIYANPLMKALGIAWQPTAGAIQVKIKSDALTDRDGDLKVYHMADAEAEPELVATVQAEDSTVVFDAESFSIYPIIDDGESGNNARIGYRFWYLNSRSGEYEQITTQYFRYKDVHEHGAHIYEPSIPGISQSDLVTIFEGWHKGTVDSLIEPAVTIEQLNAELAAKAEDDYVEGEMTDIFARLKEAYYITYVDVNANNILGTDLIVKEGDNQVTFTVKDSIKPTKYENKLTGWKLLEDIDDPTAQVYIPGQQYPVTSNITLAPIIEGGYWLIFDDNDLINDGTGKMISGGASYTAPAFYMNSSDEKQPTMEPEDPEWTGYEFGGWYEDEACTTPFVFGELLTEDTTVHAKWTPSNSSYRVIVWKQKATDGVNIADADKKYDYDYSELYDVNVKTGELVRLDSSYTTIYGENGTSTDTDKKYFTFNAERSDPYTLVKADGSSVLNVYYDRVPVTLNFYTWKNDYLYTETDSETASSQYGIVNGEYVELTHLDGEDTYTYTYDPTYVQTTADTGIQFGIIDGQYVELERVPHYTYSTHENFIPATSYSVGNTYYGVVDGEFVQLDREYTYTYNGPEYTYTPTTSNTGTQYGLIDGEYRQLNYQRAYAFTWTYGWNNTPYTGVLYDRSGFIISTYTDSGYTTETKFVDNNPGTYYGRVGNSYERLDHTRGNRDYYWTYDNASFDGTRYTRTGPVYGEHTYDGDLYYRSYGRYYPFTGTDNGTQTLYARVGDEYFQVTRGNTPVWTYNGNEYTGNVYQYSAAGIDYDGIRYTRTGNAAPYNYTPTDDNTGSQFGVITSDNGHVGLDRSATYTYRYNGVDYEDTRYLVSSEYPVTYSGRLYTFDGNSYVQTDENGTDRFGIDDNGVYRKLDPTVKTAQLWGYTDNNGTHYYSGKRYIRSNNKNDCWSLYKSFTGLYGSTLADNHYTWPSEYDWYSTGSGRGGNTDTNSSYHSTSGTRTTFMAAFMPSGGLVEEKFYGNDPSGRRTIYFNVQELDGTYSVRDQVNTSGGSFNIMDKYEGFHPSYYSVDGERRQTVGDKNERTGYYGSSISYSNRLDIYFDRINYKLAFYTNNGTNELIEKDVPFDAPLSSYASQNHGQKDGYYFVGWYADPGFHTLFNFDSNMPAASVAVHGYWRMERIRVVIVPGANNVNMGSQSTAFRLDYDERINGTLLESATRAGYILDGWYTDPEFTNKFLFSTPVNSGVEGVDMTYQTSSKWASARTLYGDDTEATNNVRGILTLYAKWIVNTNLKGVNIEYDAGEAGIYDANGTLMTTVPVDPQLYQDNSNVVIGQAPSGYSDMYYFDYWEAIDSRGNVLTVTDSNGNQFTQLSPGSTFNVNGVEPYSTVDDEDGNPIIKTIRLRAKYTKSEEAAERFTTITYDGNKFDDRKYPTGTTERQGHANDGTERIKVTLDKEINQTIELPTADDFYMEGFELVGWSFFDGDYDSQIRQANDYNREHPDDPVIVRFELGQKVAADNLEQNPVNDEGNTLYAMWRPKEYTVTVNQVVESGVTDHNFTYTYQYGEKTELSASSSKTLTDNDSFNYSPLQYYDRVGHVFKITAPTISDSKNYAVRVNAVVIKDDGTRETIEPDADGNYRVLGDVEITYTYSLKVQVTIEKRALDDKNRQLTGAKFELEPVTYNSMTEKWDTIGSTSFEYDMSSVSTLTRWLQEGDYRVTEIASPENYAVMGEPVILTVKRDEPFVIKTENGSSVSADAAELTGSSKHTLRVYDRPIRTVIIRKVVEGDDLEPNGYSFEVLLKLNGSAMKNYDTVGAGNAADKTNSAGMIELKIKNGETKELRIPWKAEVVITERNYAQYKTRTSAVNAVDSEPLDEARIFSFQVDENATIIYINKKILPAPTGLKLFMSPFLWMLVLGFAILFIGKVRPETLRRTGKRGDADE